MKGKGVNWLFVAVSEIPLSKITHAFLLNSGLILCLALALLFFFFLRYYEAKLQWFGFGSFSCQLAIVGQLGETTTDNYSSSAIIVQYNSRETHAN